MNKIKQKKMRERKRELLAQISVLEELNSFFCNMNENEKKKRQNGSSFFARENNPFCKEVSNK